MKQFLKYGGLVMLAVLSTLTVSARTVYINVDDLRGDLTASLRDACKKVPARDTLMITFGRGTYSVNGTIQCSCHTVIKGQGRDKTTIILNKGNDKSGFKAFPDDTFFKFAGKIDSPISLEISDLTFKLKEHKGIGWEDSRCHAVKVYHADGVNIHHVDSYMQNAIITNFDLRVCSNVTVSDCIINNYNNCSEGGNLWLRGDMHNVHVYRNKFYKYGNDEVIGVFGNIIDANSAKKGNISYRDLLIEDNEITYGYNGRDKDPDLQNHTLMTLHAGENQSKWVVTTNNFRVRNNKFSINDECKRCILLKLQDGCRHQGITFEGNKIVNADLHSSKQYYRQDFEISDVTAEQDTIHLINNSVTNKNSVLNSSKEIGYSFLLIQGGNVDMNGNKIVSTVTTDPYTGRATGVQLVYCGAKGGTVLMRNNVCKGVKCISTVGEGSGTKYFKLTATNNYFEGDTRVYSHKIEQMDLDFSGNTFKSNNMNFFLHEFANKGSVVFNNNDVTVTQDGGKFMTHWSKTPTNSMKFKKLEVKNNVFRGVKNENDLFKHMTNVDKRTIRSNTVKR